MQLTLGFVLSAAALAAAQFVPPPPTSILSTTQSGVLPVLPTSFTGVAVNQGAIISKAPANASYTPVLGPALTQSNVPAATYIARLPARAFNELTGTIISGSISGAGSPNGTGVIWTISLSNLPNVTAYGPFGYHIHNVPVPADGNCTGALSHFDPTNAGEYYMCNRNATQNCQAGDLSGKHGMIMTGGSYNITYVDNFLSTSPGSQYFFGARSIVIHTTNTTRLTCANFTLLSNGTGTTPNATTSRPPTASFTGGAAQVAAGGTFAAMLAVLGLML